VTALPAAAKQRAEQIIIGARNTAKVAAQSPEQVDMAIEKRAIPYIRTDQATPESVEENDIVFQLPSAKRFG
jgi:hypothetical protein